MRYNIHDVAVGKWRNLLPSLGVHESFLTGSHGPCPICGGEDRFRFDNKAGRGTWFCNKCGAGSGIDLIMRLRGLTFREAADLVKEQATGVPSEPYENAQRVRNSERFVSQWLESIPLAKVDPVSMYLTSRKITMDKWPTMLRFCPRATYFDEKTKDRSNHPAMVALYVDKDAQQKTVHYTFLDHDGKKAKVPKPKKLAPCKIPAGGAVRLAPSAEVMGVAEGIETALSAMMMWNIPVWATLSADRLAKWEPPSGAQKIIVFGDNDDSYAGQHCAYALAYRLRIAGRAVVVEIPPTTETDWNDVLCDTA